MLAAIVFFSFGMVMDLIIRTQFNTSPFERRYYIRLNLALDKPNPGPTAQTSTFVSSSKSAYDFTGFTIASSGASAATVL